MNPLALKVCRDSAKSWHQAKARVLAAEPYGNTHWLDIADAALRDAEHALITCVLLANERITNVAQVHSMPSGWRPVSLNLDGVRYRVEPDHDGGPRLVVGAPVSPVGS